MLYSGLAGFLCLDSLNLNFDTANQSNTTFFISPVPWSCYHRDSLLPINIYFLGDFMFTPDFSISYRTRWAQGSFASSFEYPVQLFANKNFCLHVWENEPFWLIPKYAATGVFSASSSSLDADQSPCLA